MNEDRPVARPHPWDDRPYSVKRHGVAITNCDSEPVQTPGCIQAHGALLVLRASDLTILQASENTGGLLGHPPGDLLGRRLSAALGAEVEARLEAFLAREPTERNPLYFLTLPPRGDAPPLDATVHTIDGLALVEFEATGRGEAPVESDYYWLLKKTVLRLQSTATLRQFCEVTVAEVRELTGFDRVMVYKFHEDRHGEVFAESKREDLPIWLGLHYPADDIPRPAREIFTRTWVRPVPDVSGGLAELVPLRNPETGKPLDLTHCSLRGVSIMYAEYLRNMGVTSGLTLSIRRDAELWGLIACHHYDGPKTVPFQVRAACEFLAQVASLQHKAAEDREHAAYRLRLERVHQQLVAAAAREGWLPVMTDGTPTLLDGMDAGGAALFHRGRWWRVGEAPSEPELDALGDWLRARPEFAPRGRPLYATDSLAAAYPPGAAFAGVASGLLALPLSREGRDLILWFRPETIRTVHWAGSPHDKPTVEGPHGPRLAPRRSFELFKESVHHRSLPWKEVELEAAAWFRLLVMELVIGRADRLAALGADLARSHEELDAFAYIARHDLKEPLRGIHKYVHQLLEGEAEEDEGRRTKLDALLRLMLRMDSLLDSLLHFSRVGRAAPTVERVDLNEVLADAVEMVGGRTARSAFAPVVPRRLPTVRCDRVRIREVFVNLLSNALKFNDRPEKRVEVGFIAPGEAGGRPGCPEGAAGRTIYYVRDNGIGIDPAAFPQVFKLFARLHGRDEYGGGTGVGLTIVKKLVEQHRGHVWIDSAPGRGATFCFTLDEDGRAEPSEMTGGHHAP